MIFMHLNQYKLRNKIRIVIYLVLSIGIIFSIQIACKKELPEEKPSLVTINVTGITSSSITSGGLIFSAGGIPVLSRGICLSTNRDPEISDLITADGTGTGSFTSTISGLLAGTTYYIRAYATNSVGTGYGNQYIVKTTGELLSLTTLSISAITSTEARSGGNITSDGGSAITARGVCWSTTTGPTTANNITSDGSGTGIFTSSITGLSAGTIYYLRSYATNSAGTAYGNEVTFTTSATKPSLSTTDVTSITSTTFSSGGNITSDGGSAVIARGVCWSTTTGPTTANNITSDGTGTGIFTSSVTGLNAGTIYYIRSYATNSVGTSYGNEISFTTGSSFANCGTITDADGNTYNTVTIGSQCWMQENLRTTKYNNGDLIGTTTPATLDITGETSPKYQWAYDGNESNVAAFGRLYTGYALTDNRGVCPTGWHVPSDEEWLLLVNNSGGQDLAGGKLKATGDLQDGTGLWVYPNVGATNETGFTGQPGGWRQGTGVFWELNETGVFFMIDDTHSNIGRLLENYQTFVRFMGAPLHNGLTVRCLRDN
jgi:uncharacterized protein (TIGR02145 family)